MKKLLTCLLLALCACGQKVDPTPDPDPEGETTPPAAPALVTGADVSWLSEMEHDGKTFRNTDGQTADLFQILADLKLNAVRLRVWVNPTGGWSGREDVVALAKRAAAKGLSVMVDFHYSDFFADPSTQTIPSAWNADRNDLTKMTAHVKDHTTEVLSALKSAGVTPAWIQIGNETRNGFLWPAGQLWTSSGDIADGWKHFVSLYNAGYAAAKAVFPEAKVMPHINNAWEDNAWWFDQFKAAGGQFDLIALSHYPQTESGKTWQQVNNLAVTNIKALAQKYNCKVMVSEIGIKASDFTLGAQVMTAFIQAMEDSGVCAGIFYWEPEVYGGWKPAVYSTLGWNAYDMGAFNSDGSPSAAFKTLSR